MTQQELSTLFDRIDSLIDRRKVLDKEIDEAQSTASVEISKLLRELAKPEYFKPGHVAQQVSKEILALADSLTVTK